MLFATDFMRPVICFRRGKLAFEQWTLAFRFGGPARNKRREETRAGGSRAREGKPWRRKSKSAPSRGEVAIAILKRVARLELCECINVSRNIGRLHSSTYLNPQLRKLLQSCKLRYIIGFIRLIICGVETKRRWSRRCFSSVKSRDYGSGVITRVTAE